jgi:hypothetical protein
MHRISKIIYSGNIGSTTVLKKIANILFKMCRFHYAYAAVVLLDSAHFLKG